MRLINKLMIAILFCLILTTHAQDEDLVVFSSERFGFSIDVPSDWIIEEFDNSPILLLTNEDAYSIVSDLRGLYAFVQFDHISQFSDSAEGAKDLMDHFLEIADSVATSEITEMTTTSNIDIAYAKVLGGVTYYDPFIMFAVTEDDLVLFIEAEGLGALNDLEEQLIEAAKSLRVDDREMYDIELPNKYITEGTSNIYSFRYPDEWFVEIPTQNVINLMTVSWDDFDGEYGEIALIITQTNKLSVLAFSDTSNEYLSSFMSSNPDLPIDNGIIFNAIFRQRIGAYVENPDYSSPYRTVFAIRHEPGYALIVQVIATDETYFDLESTIMRIISSFKYER